MLLVPPGRLDYLDLDVARWDVLLSPNPVSTPRLRKAFGFDGPVWETGYPRNDLLLGPRGRRHPGRRTTPSSGSTTTRPRCSTPRPGATTRSTTRASTEVPHAPAPRRPGRHGSTRPADAAPGAGPAAQPDDRPLARRGGAGGGRRVVLPRRQRALPGRRRAGHRLLLGDVRLRAHRQADRLLRLRPGPVPRRDPRVLLRPAPAGPRAGGADRGRAGRRAAAPRPGRRSPSATRRSASTYGGLEDGHATDRVLERLGLL